LAHSELDGVNTHRRGLDEGSAEFVPFVGFVLGMPELGVIVDDGEEQRA
jgi:hypothetical protein